MNPDITLLENDPDCLDLEAFLVDRIYEFNTKATGYTDGRLLAGCIRDDRGDVIAAFNGHTWGGCCELSHVWVHEHFRGKGLGEALMQAAEAEAMARGCVQLILATHSFQAPRFYERLGYERRYSLDGRPQGHSQIFYSKALPAEGAR